MNFFGFLFALAFCSLIIFGFIKMVLGSDKSKNQQKNSAANQNLSEKDVNKIFKEIDSSSDVKSLISKLSYRDIQIRNRAKERLIQIAKTTGDPNTFRTICREIDLDEATFENALDRIRDKDLLYSVAGGIWNGNHPCVPIDAKIKAARRLEAAAQKTNDPNEFLKICTTITLDTATYENAMDRIRDNDFLYSVAMGVWNRYSLKNEDPNIKIMALDRITDRDTLWKIAITKLEWEAAIDRLDEEQKSRFYEERERIYEEQCRHAQHAWVILSHSDTHNESADIRGYTETRQCRHCGRKELVDQSDAYGSKTTVLEPGKYDSD